MMPDDGYIHVMHLPSEVKKFTESVCPVCSDEHLSRKLDEDPKRTDRLLREYAENTGPVKLPGFSGLYAKLVPDSILTRTEPGYVIDLYVEGKILVSTFASMEFGVEGKIRVTVPLTACEKVSSVYERILSHFSPDLFLWDASLEPDISRALNSGDGFAKRYTKAVLKISGKFSEPLFSAMVRRSFMEALGKMYEVGNRVHPEHLRKVRRMYMKFGFEFYEESAGVCFPGTGKSVFAATCENGIWKRVPESHAICERMRMFRKMTKTQAHT